MVDFLTYLADVINRNTPSIFLVKQSALVWIVHNILNHIVNTWTHNHLAFFRNSSDSTITGRNVIWPEKRSSQFTFQLSYFINPLFIRFCNKPYLRMSTHNAREATNTAKSFVIQRVSLYTAFKDVFKYFIS